MRRPLVNILDGSYTDNEVKTVPSKKPLLSFVIEEDLLQRVENFRYDHRFPSRAAAIKWLLEWALKQAPRPEK